MSSWDCPKCNEVNPCSKTVCRSCGYSRFQYQRSKVVEVQGVHRS